MGSTIAINLAYARQQNFPEYLNDSLGSIDSSTNNYFDHNVDIKGIVAQAGGIQYPGILQNDSIPVIFFHGTCDAIVPYISGPLYSCEEPDQIINYYGAWYLSGILNENYIPYQLYTNEGYGHDAATDDTVFYYSAKFFKSILCEDANTIEYYRLNEGGCVVANANEITTDVYPVPFDNVLYIDVYSALSDDIKIELFNSTGQIVYRSTAIFSPPLTKFEIQFSSHYLPHGIYILKVWAGEMILQFFK